MTTRRWPRWGLSALLVVNALWLVLFLLAYAVPLPERGDQWSQVVEYRDGTPAHVFLASDDKWRLDVALDDVDPKLIESLVALEDKRFWNHDGVDPLAVVRAAWSNLTSGRRVSGGSTLTMQLARLLEPRPRTLPNKLLDMFRAFQLDLRLSKRDILESYLAHTPYGDNVEGVASAAWSYFGHSARYLTPLEIATLLAVPQGPARLAPSPDNQSRLRARRDAILAKLIAAKVFSDDDAVAAIADAERTPPPSELRPMPRAATHAAIALRQRDPLHTQVRSLIDRGAQELVERVVALHAPVLRTKLIHNAAVVVVDHRTREVVALAGNLDFADTAHGGQIAMFQRPRSPGSTLKPLLYALAIDRGLALPGYLVADVPSQYGSYRPRNYDDDFAGLVRLEDALARSLNLPFIELLNRLGVERFTGELDRLGVSHARSAPGTYGLSMIVGGIEVTPLELAGVYATLAEDGRYLPLRLLADDAVEDSAVTSFAPGAAHLTRVALTKRDRPDFPRRRQASGVPAEIHWKTGTSYGLRDAWAVGSGPRYTVVVWTGNVDNRPSADLVGSEAAGPLMFDILEGLADRTQVAAAANLPADLAAIEVCSYSGFVASDACPHRVTALARVHAVPITPCPYHHAFEVDRETGEAVLPACRVDGRDYERKTFVVLPSAVTSWLADRHRSVPEAPRFAASCAAALGGPPVVVAPSEGQVVTLLPGVPVRSQRVALAASTTSATLSWFVDGEHLATITASERVYWEPTPGTHDIVVADATGRKARRKLVVR